MNGVSTLGLAEPNGPVGSVPRASGTTFRLDSKVIGPVNSERELVFLSSSTFLDSLTYDRRACMHISNP